MPDMNSNSPPYAPTSPAFNPTTPDEPPSASGGGDEYYVGEQVYLRGGKKADRLWHIRNVGGNFITIGTNDMDGIDDLDDSIQVVRPNEIYRPSEVVYNNQPTQFNPVNHMNPFEYQSSIPEPSKMNFTPVINVVTGSNNTIDSMPTAQATPISNSIEPLPVVSTFSIDGGSNTNIHRNDSAQVISEKSNNNEIDFSKGLLIKKV
jgi:hypothetical protein